MRESLDEQFRKASLAIASAIRDGDVRSVCFASSTRREGTTTTVLQIARHLKETSGIRPLLVEFNRHRPCLARMFELDSSRSVGAIAAGKKTPRDCVQEGPEGLAVLPVGEFESSSELKLEPVLQEIKRDLEPAFGVILWDAPSILQDSDVFVLARVVPRMVLVVESGKTRYEVLERVEKELSSNQVQLLGSILVKQKRFIPGWVYRFLVE